MPASRPDVPPACGTRETPGRPQWLPGTAAGTGGAQFSAARVYRISVHTTLGDSAKALTTLAPAAAVALPMAVDTAQLGLELLDVTSGATLLVSGGGTTTGFAAVQLARRTGARVLTSAGPTHAEALRATGAEVTPYGEGMAERIRELAGGPVDVVLDVSPPDDATIPELPRTVTDPRHVLTISNLAQARASGARDVFTEGPLGHRYDVVGECAQLAAEGRFGIPVARRISLADWREAIELSQSQHPGGKIVLQITEPR